MPSDWTTMAITATLSGGSLAAVASLITARTMSRRTRIEERTTPAQIQSILVGGAEKAVASLVVALEWAEAEIRDLKEESVASRSREAAKDARIAELEVDLSSLRIRLEEVQSRITQLQALAHEARSDEGDTLT